MKKIKERGKIYALHKASEKLHDYYGSAMLNVVQFDGHDIQRAYVDGHLQTEQNEVDLEKEIKNRIDNLSNLYCYMEDLFNGKEEEGVYPIPEKVTNELFEFAKYFYELGLKAKGE